MSDWISWVEAQEILGVRHESIQRFRRQGVLHSRRERPSLNRVEVEALAAQRTEERARPKPPAVRERKHRPPDEEHEWLTLSAAAEVLGVSTVRVAQLTRDGRVPVTEVRGRRWYRRDLLELVANARELRKWMRSRHARNEAAYSEPGEL